LAANTVAVLRPRREVKCMNEISSGVALWILDKWRLSKSQLQASIFRDGKSDGTPATIEEISPGKEKVSAWIVFNGQPAKWTISLAGCRSSFGVPSEAAPVNPMSRGLGIGLSFGLNTPSGINISAASPILPALSRAI
jgi:hypothetical protein